MRLIEVENYEEMSVIAAKMLFEKIKKSKKIVMGLATGGTPVGLYRNLIEYVNKARISLNHVHTINLDEYIGISVHHPESYHQFMKKHLFDHIRIPIHQTHIPNGEASDLEKECTRYEQLIEDLGGIDIQLLGVGSNGHIGFNEPGTPFNSKTHVLTLADSTRESNARFFEKKEEVPQQAITMGIATIIKSKEILLLASGKSKAKALNELVHGEVSTYCPVTILQRHPNVTIVADNAALNQK